MGAWVRSEWQFSVAVCSAGLFWSFIPVIRHFASPDRHLPFFPFISLLYGIYYFAFGLLPFEPYYTMATVSQEGLLWGEIYALIGVISMQAGYYLFIKSYPGSRKITLDLAKDASLSLVLIGLAGVIGWLLTFIKLVPLSFQMVITLTSELLVFAFSGLFYLQLKNIIKFVYLLTNWFVFFPIIVFTTLATSLLYPMLRIILLAFLIYVFIKNTIPWRNLAMTLVVLLPIFFLKTAFRQLETASNKEKFSGIGQMAQRVQIYQEAGQVLIENLDSQTLLVGYNTMASRFDLTHMFGFVVDFTPSQVPHLYGKTYHSLLWKPIPRVLYPSKPKENWGNELGHRFGWLGEDDDDTSVNMPQMIELYLNFGIIGVTFGMFFVGTIYAVLIRFLYSGFHPIQGLIALFLLSSLFNIESNFSLVFGGLPYTILFLGFIIKQVFNNKIESIPESLEPRPSAIEAGTSLTSQELASPT
ncbi:MAG: hypothetical protein Q8K67_12665 [Geothrix sp.]|nr:hypothetical protein [Geothrix sp.]